MSAKQDAYAVTAKTIISNLEKRNMEGFYCSSKEELVKTIMPMLEKGASVAWGGSESFKESGMPAALEQDGSFELIDRLKAVTPEDRRRIFGQTAVCDYFFMSTNAITLNGELVNIDGNGNRVSALIHGPQHVFIIAGMNKVTRDVEDGIKRIRVAACPPNGVRLNKSTPCAKLGRCGECLSDECMCNQIVITRRSGHAGRIKVFLVGEELGF
ncbi:MAG: lactate utilization protein [Lachnospiraceae bacterium]